MSNQHSSLDNNQESGKALTRVCVILGALAFVALNHVTEGKVPGGAIGGAIGGVIGGLVGFVITSLAKK